MQQLTDQVALEKREVDGVVVGILWVDNPPVNALSVGVRQGLKDGIRAVTTDDEIQAVVLTCRGRTFIAGADIREFGKPRQSPDTNLVRIEMEGSTKPLVAAIHGTALGGGLEMALACHYRVAVPDARVGLPEVKLGILPGGGGTQRLPRVVGAHKALEMIGGGEPIPAVEANEVGLLDEVIDGDLLEGALTFSAHLISSGAPLKRVRDDDSKVAPARGKPEIFAEFRRKVARRTRGFLAPEKCIRAIEAAVELPVDEGLKREAELSRELHSGGQSGAQRYYFFSERQARRVEGVDASTRRRPIRSVGVIGAGTMGGGISMSFANAGIPVTIVEVSDEALDRGLGVMRANYERSAKRGRFTEAEVDERLGRITGSLSKDSLAYCDLVVEAVFENMGVKKETFLELDAVCRGDAILASNTSYLDVNEIASVTSDPSRVIGTHFFSPANVMKLVEIVRGRETAPDVLATCQTLARGIGKIPVVVGVCHGFVGNRMLAQRRREADRLVLEGALPWDVDRVLYDFGFPMGPFAMSDLAGLDIGWQKEASTSSTLREMLCERGRFGQKSGSGYYVYDSKTRASLPDPGVEGLIRELAQAQNIERRVVSDEEILERCLYSMVLEGAKILEEKIAARGCDIDVIWVNGYGWPVYRGGPMYWADSHGLDQMVDRCDELAAAIGDEWQVPALLRDLATQGRRLSDS
ncbi:MAG: 3-hydroxyacyl-CoA dehydrogenase NAD-binding domain-containing protein [Acidobacteriota bacterium]|nr:3-hydroxyacyl-CoA dehydrogenase NAD-binding domain-containing protein [Acidobacteriota bacterium]